MSPIPTLHPCPRKRPYQSSCCHLNLKQFLDLHMLTQPQKNRGCWSSDTSLKRHTQMWDAARTLTTLQTRQCLSYEVHTATKKNKESHIDVTWSYTLAKVSCNYTLHHLYLYIKRNQNHAFVYVHFDTYKYKEYVLKLYKPDKEGSSFLGGEWNRVGVKWNFVVSLLFNYFYLLDLYYFIIIRWRWHA